MRIALILSKAFAMTSIIITDFHLKNQITFFSIQIEIMHESHSLYNVLTW